VFFAPYDASSPAAQGRNESALQTDIGLIETVTHAKQAYDAAGGTGAANETFAVRFCVYNLLDLSYVAPLIAAAKAGVQVQVLMDYKNLQKPYVKTYDWFKNASLRVPSRRNATQHDLSEEERRSVVLLGIRTAGLMHMKLRYFSWLPTPTTATPTRVVVSGSFNPEDGALDNEDTLLLVHDEETIGKYMRAYMAVRDGQSTQNAYDPSLAVNLLFSQAHPQATDRGGGTPVRETLLDLVRTESELVLLSVYALRDVADENGTLVGELCAATRRGVAVAVLVDKGQADGESGFAEGDESLTALRLWKSCGIPVYKCENYAGKFNAMHHKNAVFGLRKRRIVWTDTANWSEASMGNGTSHATPHNAETTMIIDSYKLDGGKTGLRFLSNALQLIRKYAYQQACPYKQRGVSKMVTAQCASHMKWDQTDWIQRNATLVLREMAETVGADNWPQVEANFTARALGSLVVSATSGPPTLRYKVNGEPDEHGVPMSMQGGAWSARLAGVPFGAVVSVEVLQLGIEPRDVVVDPAFDWDSAPPVRRDATQLGEMRVTIPLDATTVDAKKEEGHRAWIA
jgi:hypothetical protein